MSDKNKEPQRHVIYSRDIMKITNCCLTSANKRMRQIRDALDKEPGAWITVKEYCDYEGFDINDIYPFLS